MYSNKIYAFFFFFFFFFITLLIFSARGGSQQLVPDYYKKTCPGLLHMVLWGVWNATHFDSRMPASLIRLHFHDCFVNGCDASLLLDDTPKIQGEKRARPNNNSAHGFEVIDNIKKDVEKWCPRIVSCADILTLVARAAVKISLHKGANHYWDVAEPWEVGLGRLDGFVPNMTGTSDINSPFDSVDALISKFAAKGLNTQDMVVLSGAHTIGMAQCRTFKSSRLYTNPTTMDPKLLGNLRELCPNNTNSDNKLAPLDGQSPTRFDNSYYKNLVKKEGVLKTDQDLESDKRTYDLVNHYRKNHESFIHDFGVSMVKMGQIGVRTKYLQQGEIREICGSRNPN